MQTNIRDSVLNMTFAPSDLNQLLLIGYIQFFIEKTYWT